MKNNSKVFAFKLAEKTQQTKTPWKAREGVAIAGCTTRPGEMGMPRCNYDAGAFC